MSFILTRSCKAALHQAAVAVCIAYTVGLRVGCSKTWMPRILCELVSLQRCCAGLTEILGDNFARGHAQASGGSVSGDAFKRLLKALGFDENGNTLGGSSNNASGKKRAGGAGASPPDKKAKTLMSFGFKKEPAKEAEGKTVNGTAQKAEKETSSKEA